MSLGRLVLRNISGSTFRSSVVFLCALLVAGLALSTVLIVHGAEESLRLASRRLGADIVVVPEGTETKIGTALLMGMPTKTWMPQDTLDRNRARAGRRRGVSPTLHGLSGKCLLLLGAQHVHGGLRSEDGLHGDAVAEGKPWRRTEAG